ncbi:hypothetical protein BATDEDRAFT_84872 [Batrachochytrium dendrobatidis JAM81]|uniref:Calnexin n=1 Tax=Batrachochytrium dendrobatidis (strain JAM81 / FGSC 10211) TaxID=684364 RepID=F4NRE9_BATDJ|nr:uncharacterized protein BATDEDRAFT_84872 [Batrachochytrium dendrobatidis JAM81]EGF83327.1 hypothetical protein BATDEDRAFT_84872 [Batrachochytrium dendrobatidis JAM81]KAK5668450.1 hypothetical protein QVD99_005471 [Batrachochytrium dendrobatidis]KAK5668517.1 hypothetical protein QVD99_005533 [Batrachochytrium dendrobatidis]|eukprot:XP_006676061.1 hypothetical protein BATDEDRAFT_84872 [Batrachochytrium dendrobatidis JAM81]
MHLFSVALSLVSTAVVVVASADDASSQSNFADKQNLVHESFKPTTLTAPFLEQFGADWEKRWIPSNAKKIVDGVEDEDLLRYRGEWAVEPSTPIVIAGDEGLVVKTTAAHHAISAKFPKPVDPTGKSLVVQYEVKLQNGLECGGAYIKLLSYNDKYQADSFEDKTPYTIMFGPDKCGTTNKVHFIFRHKNPLTGELEEKHLSSPPTAKIDTNTNLYTLIVRPDQTFDLLINNVSASSGSLFENFSPPVNPAAEIDDPSDRKPMDWDDNPKISDPAASKPADWDENAPMEIPDETASEPADWLTNEPLTIPDPTIKKPEDWDDEEDGEWTAPLVANPKCETVSGCGKWQRPLIKNPAYKGKWVAPFIDNPKYKGMWAPRKVANPHYFNDKTPSNFGKIGAIGIELWTMTNGIQFDNIYVGHSADDAKKLAEETWAVKYKIESAAEKVEKVEKGPGALDKAKQFAEILKDQSLEFVARVQESPLDAVKEMPHIVALFVAVLLLPVLLFSLFASKSAPAEPEEEEEEEEEEDEEEEEEEEAKETSKLVKETVKAGQTPSKSKSTPKKE